MEGGIASMKAYWTSIEAKLISWKYISTSVEVDGARRDHTSTTTSIKCEQLPWERDRQIPWKFKIWLLGSNLHSLPWPLRSLFHFRGSKYLRAHLSISVETKHFLESTTMEAYADAVTELNGSMEVADAHDGSTEVSSSFMEVTDAHYGSMEVNGSMEVKHTPRNSHRSERSNGNSCCP